MGAKEAASETQRATSTERSVPTSLSSAHSALEEMSAKREERNKTGGAEEGDGETMRETEEDRGGRERERWRGRRGG